MTITRTETTLSASFGVPVVIPPPKTDVVEFVDSYIDDDEFATIGTNLEALLEKGTDAIETLSEIAKVEESPRAFEALNTMIGTMASINMQMIELQERKAKLKKLRGEVTPGNVDGSTPTTVNNNMVFVGTTQELHQLIRQRLKESTG